MLMQSSNMDQNHKEQCFGMQIVTDWCKFAIKMLFLTFLIHTCALLKGIFKCLLFGVIITNAHQIIHIIHFCQQSPGLPSNYSN